MPQLMVCTEVSMATASDSWALISGSLHKSGIPVYSAISINNHQCAKCVQSLEQNH